MKDDDGRTVGMFVRVRIIENASGSVVNGFKQQAAVDERLWLHSATERRRELGHGDTRR